MWLEHCKISTSIRDFRKYLIPIARGAIINTCYNISLLLIQCVVPADETLYFQYSLETKCRIETTRESRRCGQNPKKDYLGILKRLVPGIKRNLCSWFLWQDNVVFCRSVLMNQFLEKISICNHRQQIVFIWSPSDPLFSVITTEKCHESVPLQRCW